MVSAIGVAGKDLVWPLAEKASPVAEGEPAGTEDEGEDGSADQDGLKPVVAAAGVAQAVSPTEEEGDATTKDEREADEPGGEPALLWGRCWNRFTAGLGVFWFHLYGAVLSSAWLGVSVIRLVLVLNRGCSGNAIVCTMTVWTIVSYPRSVALNASVIVTDVYCDIIADNISYALPDAHSAY